MLEDDVIKMRETLWPAPSWRTTFKHNMGTVDTFISMVLDHGLVCYSYVCHNENIYKVSTRELVGTIHDFPGYRDFRELDDVVGKGKALGAARNWMQFECINGGTVEWSSDETLRRHGPLTVADIEGISVKVFEALKSR
jgi:hypothetical protein